MAVIFVSGGPNGAGKLPLHLSGKRHLIRSEHFERKVDWVLKKAVASALEEHRRAGRAVAVLKERRVV